MSDDCVYHSRRYLPYGKVVHLLRADLAAGSALCGRYPSRHWDDWLGTGSQVEYETAAALPLCKDCERLHDAAHGWR